MTEEIRAGLEAAERNAAKQIDPGAFIIVSNSSEIIGKGFRGV